MSAVVNPEKFLVRDMGDDDLDRVIAIEKKLLISTHGPKKIFRDCLTSKYFCLVAELDNCLVAYCIISMAAGEGHILNVCVCPNHRNQKIAQRLIEFAIQNLVDKTVELLFLEVRVSKFSGSKTLQKFRF